MSNNQTTTNAFGQKIGRTLDHWVAPSPVQSASLTRRLQGNHCSLQRLELDHLDELMSTFEEAPDSLWTYLPYGPMQSKSDYELWLQTLLGNTDEQVPYVIRTTDGKLGGVAAYLRTNPQAGSIEIGHLCFAPSLQRTVAATEALYMMIEAVFLLGYRRCEWKCNDLNAPSIAAAKRLGFVFEGTFRNAQIVKGANRDTAWFSIIEEEWPDLKVCFESWLASENFDDQGQQKTALSDLVSKIGN